MSFGRRAHTVLIVLSLCFVHTTWATQPILSLKKLSLKEAILLSLRFNPNVESAQLQRVIDKFNLAVAKNQFEFQYALTGTANTNETITSGVSSGLNRNFLVTPAIQKQNIFGTTYNLSFNNPWSWNSLDRQTLYSPLLTLNVTQPIIQGSGRDVVEAPLNVARINNEIAKLNLKNTIIKQVTTIVTDYLTVVGAENVLIVDTKAWEEAKKTVVENKKRIEIGFLAPSENDQAKAAVASTAIQVEQDKNIIQQAKLQLLTDIGLSPSTPIEVDKNIELRGMNYPRGEVAKQIMLTHNISYLQILLQLEASQLGLLLAEDQQRWILNAIGTITQGGGSGIGPNGGLESLTNGLNQGRAVGLQLSIPIDNMPNQALVVNAKIGYDQLKLAAKLLKLTLEATLQGSLESLRLQYVQLSLTKQSEFYARKSYDNALKKLAHGKSTMFEVTTLQTNYVTAQTQTILANISYLQTIALLQQNLGSTLDVWNIDLVY